MELFSLFFNFLLALLLIVYLFIHRKQQYWQRLGLPFVEPQFLYGNSKGIDKDFPAVLFFRDIYLKYKSKGPIFGCYVYTEPQAIITDLDLIKTIMVKEFNTFPSRGSYHNEKDDPVSANLANVDKEKWRNLRNKLTPTFTSGKIKLMFPIIVDVSDKLIDKIEEETEGTGQLEIKDILSRFTTDVIGEAAFGIECNSLNNPQTEFYKYGLRAFGKINHLKRLLTSKYPDLAKKLHITSSDKEVADFYRNIVEQTIKYREENKIERNDFMNLLMNTRNTPDPLSFNEIWAQSVVFFLAGYETSSTALTYILYELSQYPDIQQKARESAIQVLKKHNMEFSYEAINEMQYIEQCAKEGLRKHPPANATRRVAFKDFKIPDSKIVLEKGTHVVIPIFGIHFDPEIYPNPEKYDPDRFSPEETAKRHHFTYLPFGEGPRNCIGERFAMVEIKLTLAKILVNFEFSLDRKNTPVPLEYAKKRLILTPKDGIFINFKKIKN